MRRLAGDERRDREMVPGFIRSRANMAYPTRFERVTFAFGGQLASVLRVLAELLLDALGSNSSTNQPVTGIRYGHQLP
jgi:hypothetical protein